jgi:RecA/RadA recombinase
LSEAEKKDRRGTTRPATMSLREAVELDGSRLSLSSGSAALDVLLGGGFRTGEMVEVFGASGTGKTQLALQSAASAAAAGFSCAYVDTEGQFRPERLSSICESRGLDPSVILPRVYFIRAESTRKQVAAIAMIDENENLGDCRMVIVDTVSKNFSLEYSGSKMVVSRQTMLGTYLNRLVRDAYRHDRAVLLLNRVASVGLNEEAREVGIGGDTLGHFVQKAVYLRRRGEFADASLVDGAAQGGAGLKITGRGLE